MEQGFGGSVALNLSKVISQCSKVLGGSVALNLSKVSQRSKVLGGTCCSKPKRKVISQCSKVLGGSCPREIAARCARFDKRSSARFVATEVRSAE